MKRRTSKVPCKVYRYGILPPDDRDVVDEQIWLAHRYYNDLIEVEHARRQAYVWARDRLPPGLNEEERKTALKAISDRLNEERKDVVNSRVRDPDWGPGLRGTCGLYSGTYLLIEDQAQQAAKKKGAPPRFRKWNGEGAIGIQCAKPIPVSELMAGTNRYAKIDSTPRRHRRTGRIVKNGVTLTCTVGPKGKTASFPMKLHRPLPADGLVRWIKIIRRTTPDTRMGGVREKWEVHITVESVSFIRPERSGPVAGIDLCWSRGRVGHLLGEDGHEASVRPSPTIEKKLQYADSVRAIRDTYLNVAKEWAALTIDARVRAWTRMSAKGMRRKMKQWREEGHVMPALEAWSRRDMHLHQIEHNVRAKAKRRLKNDYRVWARHVADRYPVLILEDLDLSKMAEENKGGKMGNATRFAYSPSHLRDALANAGARIIKVPAQYTSNDCPACGATLDGSYHARKCHSCGWEGDRREGAARNILARGLAALGRPGPASSCTTVSRRSYRHSDGR